MIFVSCYLLVCSACSCRLLVMLLCSCCLLVCLCRDTFVLFVAYSWSLFARGTSLCCLFVLFVVRDAYSQCVFVLLVCVDYWC